MLRFCIVVFLLIFIWCYLLLFRDILLVILMCIILLWFLRDMDMRILLFVSFIVIKLCIFFFCMGEVGFLYNSSLFVFCEVNFSESEFILYC